MPGGFDEVKDVFYSQAPVLNSSDMMRCARLVDDNRVVDHQENTCRFYEV